MAEDFRPSVLPAAREARWRALTTEILAVVAGEESDIARFASAASMLRSGMGERFYWVGFYLVDPQGRDELVVGPYQGTLGCLRIPFGRGVCGLAAQSRRTIRVDDVSAFPDHIACDAASRSELVVPVFDVRGTLRAVLDVDSREVAAFDDLDQAALEELCSQLLA